jgi:hypothetical protein
LLNKTTFYFLKFFAVISLFFSFARSTNQKEEKKVAITQGWNNKKNKNALLNTLFFLLFYQFNMQLLVFQQFQVLLTLFSEFFSSFPYGT